MISPKNAVGSRIGGAFSNKRRLLVGLDENNLKKWTLTNSKVSFTFIEDPITGVRLKEWTADGFTESVVNRSRNLWQLNMLRSYLVNTGTNAVMYDTYNVYPSARYFIDVSIIPQEDDEFKYFTFEWQKVNFDKINIKKTCDVKLKAKIHKEKDYLDLSLEIASYSAYLESELVLGKSCTVTAVHFPTLLITKDEDESVNESSFLSSPVAVGYTYANPFKHLRVPRFEKESFQFNHRSNRTYATGFVGAPLLSIKKYNYGSPGGMNIPVLIVGNKEKKQGTLIYAMDKVGTNPKGFQWYADDNNLHIKLYHNSDSQLDPYGVGGYYIEGDNQSYLNAPSWSMRIRPYKSETTWVDWKGYEIYRKDAIPEQESYGWLPKSFYSRFNDGLLPKEAIEFPLILNMFGFTTGSVENMQATKDIYSNIYKNSTRPSQTNDPYIPIHYQPVSLNYIPNRSDISGSYASSYYGWYPWSVSGYGPDAFKSPDYSVNTTHSTTYQSLINSKGLLYHYDIFPYIVTTGSTWTQTNNSIDLCSKGIVDESNTYSNNDYALWAKSGLGTKGFDACFSPEINLVKFVEKAINICSQGVNSYHDTLGLFGRGCYAKSHKYGTSLENEHKHPRGAYTNYFNDLQVKWLREYNASILESQTHIPSEAATALQLASSSEYPSDVLLSHTPISLLYEPLGPIANIFFNKISDPRPDAILNRYGSINIDKESNSNIQGYLSGDPGLEYWACLIQYPNWIQRCPAYQITLNDRSIINDWSGPQVTNAFSKFFSGEAKTGIGPYGQILTKPVTQDSWAESWACYGANSWANTNRVAAWHVDNQAGLFRPDLVDLENNETTVFTGATWSGLFSDFSTKLFRIQAYNPDYIYHGNFDHPLETWESSFTDGNQVVDTVGIFKAATINCLNSDTGYVGLDRTPHTVRRHRNNNNLLIIIGNWQSGQNLFSGVFDPAKYEITNGYQVYSLDVNTQDHGTKTLLATKNSLETFDIVSTLNKFDYSIYEIEVNSSYLDPNVFADLKTDYSPVRYSYDVLPINTDSISFAYSYGASNTSELKEPMVGYRSPSTQQILNNVPQWMKGRQSFESTMWKLVNSWGMSVDNVIEQSYKNASDLNIVTADTTYLSKLSYTDITSKELLENRVKKNILFNSSFSIRDVSRTKLPAGWELYGASQTAEIDYRNSSVSPCSVTSYNGSLKLGQQIILDNKLINNMTGSIYIKCNADTTNVKLFISIEKTDGTSDIFSAMISTRSTEWRRLVLPITINSQVYRINYTVLANCSDTISVCAPQLEIEGVSNWSSAINDYLPYYSYPSRFNAVYALTTEKESKKIPIFNIAEEDKFLDCNIPTRITLISPPSKSISPFTTQAFGRKVDQLGTVIRTEFTVFDEKIVERSISPTSWDIFNRYEIKDLRYYEDLAYGIKDEFNVKIFPITTAIRKDVLFVVCREQYNNNTYRTLKIVRPRTTPNGEKYLESLVDFDLSLNFDTLLSLNQINDQEVFSIAFSDIDPSYMLLTTTTNNKYYYKLYFDYYYFDNSKNRMYTIENYRDANLTVI